MTELQWSSRLESHLHKWRCNGAAEWDCLAHLNNSKSYLLVQGSYMGAAGTALLPHGAGMELQMGLLWYCNGAAGRDCKCAAMVLQWRCTSMWAVHYGARAKCACIVVLHRFTRKPKLYYLMTLEKIPCRQMNKAKKYHCARRIGKKRRIRKHYTATPTI